MRLDTPVFVRCPKCGSSMLNLRHNEIDIEYGFVRCNNCGFRFDNETLGITPSNHTISLKLPNLPKTISIRDEENSSWVKLSITDINYSYVNGIFHFTISGRKKFDNLGDCNLTDCFLTWMISNTSKRIFETNDIYISSLFTDDDFTVDFETATPMFTNKDMVLQFSLSPTKKQEEQPEECNYFEFKRLWDDTLGVSATGTINVEEIIIPEEYGGYKVSTIFANGFKEQTNLKSVIIPSSVKKIESGAFAGCINLKELKTSENLIDIENDSFENCPIEKAILPITVLPYIDLENLIWLEITKGSKYGYLSEDRIKGRFADACPKLEKLVIHKGITAIEDYSFYQCKKLKNIFLTEDIRIGKGGFCACPSIDELIIPSGVEICDSAFSQCKIKKLVATKKTSYVWSDSFAFSEIEKAVVSTAFINSIENCDIYDLEIRGNGKSIYGNPFVYGNHLSKIIISPNVTELDKKVFKRCPIKNASFPMDVFECIPKENLEIVEILRGDAIPDYAFSDCEKLKEVIIDSSVTNVADYAFSGCPIEKATVSADLITKVKNDNLKFVIIHSGTTIKDYAFNYCELLEKVELPDSIITIGKNAFSNCCNLVNITLPHNITSIGEYAFSGCEKLESIVLPLNITTITERMFKGCSSLKNINIHSNIRSIEERAFEGCKELTCIIIPPTVKNIGEDIFYGCENLESLTLYFLGKDENDNDSTIDYYYGYSDSISSLKRLNIHKKEINKLVDLISKARIEEIIIGKNVEHIAVTAFEHCLSLKQITVEDGNLYYHAENGCLIHTESKTLLLACDFSTIPKDGSVCVIESGACCSFFPPHIPPTITKIKRGAFTEDVHFEGRLIEWQKIEKNEDWNLAWKSGYAKVFCTDGTLSKIKE